MRASGLGLEKAENVAVRAARAIVLAIAILLLVPMLSVISDSQVPSFGRNVMVNLPNQYDQGVPELAVSLDGVIYVVWVEYGNGDDDIIFAKSVDGGVSFCCYRRVNDDTLNASQTYASVAVGIDGSIHVSWRDYRNDLDREFVPGGGIDGVNDADIYYSMSDDGGSTFSPNVKVNDDTGHFQTTHMHRFIVVDHSGKVHIAWSDYRNGDSEVYYANSVDGGLTFNVNLRISDGNGTASEPSIASSQFGDIHIVWTDGRNESAGERIFLSISTDGGESFGENLMIDKSNGQLGQLDPEVSAAGTTVGVSWYDAVEDKVFVSISQDGGATFSQPERPSNSSSLVPELEPSVFVNESGYVAVSWRDRRTNDYDIYFSESYDFGQTFGTDVRVNDDATTDNQYQPSLWVDHNGYALVVWMDFRSGIDWDVYFARSPSTLADLVVTSSDIAFSPGGPVPFGITVVINATVWNFGDGNASDVAVAFYDGQPGEGGLIGTDTTSFVERGGGHGHGEIQWTAVEPQFHDICVHVDPLNEVTESNETNNTACRMIEVIVPPIPAPPGNLTARLSGNGFSNVTLEWSLSPDDGGPINVSRYDVFRSESYDTARMGYVPRGTVTNGTGEYVDEGAGEGDPDNHFYYVCAIGDMNISSCTEDQVGKFTRVLNPGPNLVSLPLIQSNESIDAVLQTVSYDAAWYFDSFSVEWTWHMTSKKYRRGLWTVDHTIGLWVNATIDCNLTVAGVVPAQTTIHLYDGWNLVSFPSFNSSYTVYDLKTDTGAVRLEGYDPTPPYHLRVLGDAEVLQAGEAYWVRIEASTDWFVNID